jgi:hypothetical protein
MIGLWFLAMNMSNLLEHIQSLREQYFDMEERDKKSDGDARQQNKMRYTLYTF